MISSKTPIEKNTEKDTKTKEEPNLEQIVDEILKKLMAART
jgi:hypothetical protein